MTLLILLNSKFHIKFWKLEIVGRMMVEQRSPIEKQPPKKFGLHLFRFKFHTFFRISLIKNVIGALKGISIKNSDILDPVFVFELYYLYM